MKKFYAILSILLTSSIGFSQDIELYDENGQSLINDTILFTHAIDSTSPLPYLEHTNLAAVVNESSSNMTIKLSRHEVQIIPSTGDYFCWGSSCFGEQASGTRPDWFPDDSAVVAPGDTAGGYGFVVYFKPYNNIGKAVYRYDFYDASTSIGGARSSVFVKYDITYVTGLKSVQKDLNYFKIFPNPTNGESYIKFNENGKQLHNVFVEIRNILGEEIESFQVPSMSDQIKLNTNNFSKGVYFISIADQNSVLTTKKLIIK